MSYHILEAETDELRRFKITCGLRHGYDSEANVHSEDFASSIIHQWMQGKCEQDLPFLTGVMTGGKVLYTWKGAEGNDSPEPVVVFSGDVSVVYNTDMIDEDVVELLNDLASQMGEKLGQTRVYVAYRDRTWVMEADGKTSPRVSAS